MNTNMYKGILADLKKHWYSINRVFYLFYKLIFNMH